ncbi:hypothetical protein ACFWIN_03435 [Streptomyces sp. NPDC127049]|uniref:hypothetical protein n=1 Tax=unclassified Streptomyces TaxID=2593676 RepID=UPI00365EB9E4
MTQQSTSRRSLLAAALATPVAVAAAPLATASPAAAASAEGCQIIVPWTAVTPTGVITTHPDNPFQARVVRLAGTDFLQFRGYLTGNLVKDETLGTLPPSIEPSGYVRGVVPRNNHLGVNAIRVEATAEGLVRVVGPQAANPVTWIQLDSFSSVLR